MLKTYTSSKSINALSKSYDRGQKKPGLDFPRKKSQAQIFRNQYDLNMDMIVGLKWLTNEAEPGHIKSLLGTTHGIWDRKYHFLKKSENLACHQRMPKSIPFHQLDGKEFSDRVEALLDRKILFRRVELLCIFHHILIPHKNICMHNSLLLVAIGLTKEIKHVRF